MPACEVCLEIASKYKCPKCRLQYCSVPCFQRHSGSADCADRVASRAAGTKPVAAPAAESASAVDEDEGPKLSAAQLGILASSTELHAQLADRRLQALIAAIDGAKDPEALLQSHLQNNDEFREWVEGMLTTIGVREPQEPR
eukprot:c9602_g2_i1.p3 GENE.c9602_g2_i1~~c9602_g2_i1.p3  ORF type:complete len:142 (-),score=29.67 c9602_g2_i1:282-707(-)